MLIFLFLILILWQDIAGAATRPFYLVCNEKIFNGGKAKPYPAADFESFKNRVRGYSLIGIGIQNGIKKYLVKANVDPKYIGEVTGTNIKIVNHENIIAKIAELKIKKFNRKNIDE